MRAGVVVLMVFLALTAHPYVDLADRFDSVREPSALQSSPNDLSVLSIRDRAMQSRDSLSAGLLSHHSIPAPIALRLDFPDRHNQDPSRRSALSSVLRV